MRLNIKMTAQARKIYKPTIKLRRIATAPYLAEWKDVVITVANFLPKNRNQEEEGGEKTAFFILPFVPGVRTARVCLHS